ncbi:MAG: hypothetical protein O2960_14780, partial [Verrucomicrobia bacterium]|nr:hypothetical protein [Verrucomicrobiota bacterium]
KIAVSQGEARASQSVAPPRETRVVGVLLGGSAEGGLPSFGDAPPLTAQWNLALWRSRSIGSLPPLWTPTHR